MKKLILLTLGLLCLLTIQSYSQTLKVSAVNASEDDLYNSVAPKALGKDMVITIYDNSAKIKIGNQPEEILKETKDNGIYEKKLTFKKEDHIYTLKVNTTLGVVTSATFSIVYKEFAGKMRYASFSVTGKRF